MTSTSSTPAAGSAEPGQNIPGGRADSPHEIPLRGWREIVVRGWKEASADQVPLLGAGVAFFGFLALFPALIALTLVYGLAADPATISTQLAGLTASLPADARALLENQLQQLASAPTQGLGWGLALSLLIALWSASGGVGNLVTAVNIAYDEQRTRGLVKEKLVALGLTVGAIVVMVVLMALVAVVPVAFEMIGLGGGWRGVAEVVRWLLVVLLVMAALAVLYRVAPDRDAPKFRWVSVGAVAATVLWLVASVGFSLYVSLFGNYAKTYGALAGVVVMLLWLWITSYAVLLGAEINAEAEEQTAKDTTRGPERPLGSRGAVKADSIPTQDERPAPLGGRSEGGARE
ncbi:YihY/virulence factor BrkB family protein [Propionicimonas sp.]|uniref:YihY/virulence factor BrkB family protein n=1 Tax=Propionicimonas sp. TaxID=1955623 RepID=UPI0039E3CC2B